MYQTAFLGTVEIRCPICGLWCVPRSEIQSSQGTQDRILIVARTITCSEACAQEAQVRVKELRNAAWKASRWG